MSDDTLLEDLLDQERRLVFDINDLDETLPAPWEWDVKRLAASFVLAARSNGLSDHVGREAAMACATAYRKRMRANILWNSGSTCPVNNAPAAMLDKLRDIIEAASERYGLVLEIDDDDV